MDARADRKSEREPLSRRCCCNQTGCERLYPNRRGLPNDGQPNGERAVHSNRFFSPRCGERRTARSRPDRAAKSIDLKPPAAKIAATGSCLPGADLGREKPVRAEQPRQLAAIAR